MNLVTRPVAELEGPALDWAVAQVEGLPAAVYPAPPHYVYIDAAGNGCGPYHPSHNWCQGGPLIEKHGIAMRQDKNNVWYAMKSTALGSGERAQWVEFSYRGGERYGPASYEVRPRRQRFKGETALIAACRAIVASQLGATVQIPEELA